MLKNCSIFSKNMLSTEKKLCVYEKTRRMRWDWNWWWCWNGFSFARKFLFFLITEILKRKKNKSDGNEMMKFKLLIFTHHWNIFFSSHLLHLLYFFHLNVFGCRYVVRYNNSSWAWVKKIVSNRNHLTPFAPVITVE